MTTTRREADVAIASIEVGDRMRKPDVPTIDELAKDLAERGVLQRIGVRERDDGKHVLIWGRHRYEAAAKVGWTEIPAVVFPADTPDRDMLMMEIVENLKRRELSEDEKREHTIRLAALIADAEPAPETRSGSEFPPKGPGGRGAAWLRHAPLDEVCAWLRLKLGVKRASALAAALAAETGVLN